MKPAYWIICGLILTGVANYYGPAPDVPGVGASASSYLPSAILINTGFFCFLIAWRGAIANLWAALIGNRPKPARKPKQGGANGSAFAKDAEPSSDFDADVAFIR